MEGKYGFMKCDTSACEKIMCFKVVQNIAFLGEWVTNKYRWNCSCSKLVSEVLVCIGLTSYDSEVVK